MMWKKYCSKRAEPGGGLGVTESTDVWFRVWAGEAGDEPLGVTT